MYESHWLICQLGLFYNSDILCKFQVSIQGVNIFENLKGIFIQQVGFLLRSCPHNKVEAWLL